MGQERRDVEGRGEGMIGEDGSGEERKEMERGGVERSKDKERREALVLPAACWHWLRSG